jgi:hypothetical protein
MCGFWSFRNNIITRVDTMTCSAIGHGNRNDMISTVRFGFDRCTQTWTTHVKRHTRVPYRAVWIYVRQCYPIVHAPRGGRARGRLRLCTLTCHKTTRVRGLSRSTRRMYFYGTVWMLEKPECPVASPTVDAKDVRETRQLVRPGFRRRTF